LARVMADGLLIEVFGFKNLCIEKIKHMNIYLVI
jgi:hypothetical protein